ncbi:hypothetical protein DH2020_001611 [Rehmannia glutinosa]|uniref:Cullin N-terminal domain-containing protein n=1 Tax=Rehmannia glutinosa TaxID=99300 RepID=A0ABR0XZU8_REHGL
MAANGVTKIIEWDEGWDFVQVGIRKQMIIIEGALETQFDSEEYMMLYEYPVYICVCLCVNWNKVIFSSLVILLDIQQSTIYSMCTQDHPHDYSNRLYEKYNEVLADYVSSTIMPSLRDKHDVFMLRELVKQWTTHKNLVTWLSRLFHYLDRYLVLWNKLSPVKEAGLACFRDLVGLTKSSNAKSEMLSLLWQGLFIFYVLYALDECCSRFITMLIWQIDQEREGEQIDRALLKNVLDIFVEVGMGQLDYYENDFENVFLIDTAAYYHRKASVWIVEYTCPDYMLKVEQCLNTEKDRVSHYLHSSSETKILEKVLEKLLLAYANQLLKKEHSGLRALLRDDKVEDLSRMYRLFLKTRTGLKRVSMKFKQHVRSEGMAVIQQAEDAASDKALVTKLMELHDKHSRRFLEFCNKFVGGTSCAELLASYYDNIVKNGGKNAVNKAH